MNRTHPRLVSGNRPRLESWVEETEKRVRLILDHYPRCKGCNQIMAGKVARPWQINCQHCKFPNQREEVIS